AAPLGTPSARPAAGPAARREPAAAPPPEAPPGKKRAAAGNPAPAAGASRYVLRLTPRADAPVGHSTTPVTLTTTVRGAETVPIQAAVFVVGRVQVTPTFLYVRPSSEPPVMHLRLATASGAGRKVLGVDTNDPNFT